MRQVIQLIQTSLK